MELLDGPICHSGFKKVKLKLKMNHREAFIQQLKSPYQSTIAFEKFLDKHVCLSDSGEILDIGTGYGGFLHYLKKKHSSLRLTGIDHDRKKYRIC